LYATPAIAVGNELSSRGHREHVGFKDGEWWLVHNASFTSSVAGRLRVAGGDFARGPYVAAGVTPDAALRADLPASRMSCFFILL
jgi:hypothetical protein